MNLLLHSLLAIWTIASATKGAAVKRQTVLQPYIKSLLNDLKAKRMDPILYWNDVTLQACANDYDPSVALSPDKLGPTETTRAFAIIHGAMYESVAAFEGKLKSLFNVPNLPSTANIPKEPAISAAVMEAAYQTLYAMYPKQRPIFDAVRAVYLTNLKANAKHRVGIYRGIVVGRETAQFILKKRQYDGSEQLGTYVPILFPGYHQKDPTNPNQGYLSPNWGNITPFLLDYGSQYRPTNTVGDTPLARQQFLNSTRYIDSFNEVKAFGSKNSTVRTTDETEIAISWAYDGAPGIGVPPRAYNQVARVVAIQQKNTLVDNALLFALVNYALGDAAIAAWDCKYYYSVWRPIVGVREASGYTQPDPNWRPLGSPSDTTAPTFTPQFPSYVSGHATLGGATFEVLRRFYGNDSIAFRFQSDEYNGKTFDSNTGSIRPALTRSYQSFTEAETENTLSRIYLGVHWRFDVEDGRTIGQKVGELVFSKLS